MNYKVGKYNIDVQKPFKTTADAVKFIQERHPELSKEEIEMYLKRKVNESNIVKVEDSKDNTESAKIGRRGGKVDESGTDK